MTGGAAPRRKGSQFERDVVAYLRDHGHPDAERAYGAGRPDDRGDIDGIVGADWTPMVVECKAGKRHDLAGWLDAAEAKAGPAGAVVIVKRSAHPTGRAYVVQSLEQWAKERAQ